MAQDSALLCESIEMARAGVTAGDTLPGRPEPLDHLAEFGELSDTEFAIVTALEHNGADIEFQRERIRALREKSEPEEATYG